MRGFTIVELLILVAILGILVAVVIPNVVGLMGRTGCGDDGGNCTATPTPTPALYPLGNTTPEY